MGISPVSSDLWSRPPNGILERSVASTILHKAAFQLTYLLLLKNIVTNTYQYCEIAISDEFSLEEAVKFSTEAEDNKCTLELIGRKWSAL